MNSVRLLISTLVLFLLLSASSFAATIPVDLNDFYADWTVSVAADGSSAFMEEDPALFSVLLSNDPYFGDPGLATPADVLSLGFDVNFQEGSLNDDTFYAKLFDGNTGTLIDDFYAESSVVDSVSWDLSSLDSAITLLGLEFQLNAWDSAFDSTASISNVAFVTQDTAPVPEPGTLVLLGVGLTGLAVFSRRRQ